MLWSSVMRSSYRSVVRSWTSSCSLMRWDCSHWDRENKTQVPMSWHTYRWVILSFMASNHPNLNVEYAPNKHTPAHWPWIPEDTIAELYKAPGAHLSLFTFLALICSLGKGPSAIAHYPHLLFFLSQSGQIPLFWNLNLEWMDLKLHAVTSLDWGSWWDCPPVPATSIPRAFFPSSFYGCSFFPFYQFIPFLLKFARVCFSHFSSK